MIDLHDEIHIDRKEYSIDMDVKIKQKDKDYCMQIGTISDLLGSMVQYLLSALDLG